MYYKMVVGSVFGIGVLALAGAIAALLTILDYLRYIPDLLVLLRNPWRLLEIPGSIVKTYRFKRFWRPIVKEGKVVVVFPAEDEDDLREGTAKFDTMGLQELIDELQSNFRDVDFEFVPDDQFGSGEKEHNIICAAGPIPNRVTRELLYENDVPFKFEKMQTGKIINKVTSENKSVSLDPETYYSEEAEQTEVRRDYGIITRTPSPYDENRIIVNAAGCWGEGTLAGFKLLTRPSVLKRLEDEGGQYFQALYVAPVDDEGDLKTSNIMITAPMSSWSDIPW